MLRRNKHIRIIALVLTLALILACAFIAFLPYSHECAGSDCSVCALIESTRRVLLAAASATVLAKAAKTPVFLLGTYSDTEPVRNETPVGLKVKLSD